MPVEGTAGFYNLRSKPLNQNSVHVLQFVSGRLFWYSVVLVVISPVHLGDCILHLN
jgi:hypothetical protein